MTDQQFKHLTRCFASLLITQAVWSTLIIFAIYTASHH